MFDFSPVQLIIVLVIALIVLGPKRLPDAARSVGKGLREFKSSISGEDDTPATRTAADTPDVVDVHTAPTDTPAPPV